MCVCVGGGIIDPSALCSVMTSKKVKTLFNLLLLQMRLILVCIIFHSIIIILAMLMF